MKYQQICKKTGIAVLLSVSMLAGCGSKKADDAAPITQAPVTEAVTPSPSKEPTQVPSVEPTPVVTEEPDKFSTEEWVKSKTDEILKEYPKYGAYEMKTFQAGEWCYVVFIKENEEDGEYRMGYETDFWAVSEGQIIQLGNEDLVVPDTCGFIEIDHEQYFRYDLAYATERITALLIVEDGMCQKINFNGHLESVNGNETIFSRTMFDYNFLKENQMGIGRTWKLYYGYIKDHELIEYETNDLSEDDFLKYDGAKEILERLKKQYTLEGHEVRFEYKLRENQLLHINILQESKEEIIYYYETEKVNGEKLETIESGGGFYE